MGWTCSQLNDSQLLSNALCNMNFGLILTTFEPFKGRVPEKAKSIKMNMIIKIPLMPDFQADFSVSCR